MEEKLVMRRAIYSLMFVTVLFFYGCLHNTHKGRADEAAIMVETVYANPVCQDASHTPKVVWIDSYKEVAAHWKRTHNDRKANSPSFTTKIQWDTHALLYIQMGQKPTGGYRIELNASNPVRLRDQVAFVNINWVAPPPNAFVPQVMTNPCLWLKIQRSNYRSVVILDQSGSQRAKVDLPG